MFMSIVYHREGDLSRGFCNFFEEIFEQWEKEKTA